MGMLVRKEWRRILHNFKTNYGEPVGFMGIPFETGVFVQPIVFRTSRPGYEAIWSGEPVVVRDEHAAEDEEAYYPLPSVLLPARPEVTHALIFGPVLFEETPPACRERIKQLCPFLSTTWGEMLLGTVEEIRKYTNEMRSCLLDRTLVGEQGAEAANVACALSGDSAEARLAWARLYRLKGWDRLVLGNFADLHEMSVEQADHELRSLDNG